ncbi:hypothetical protein [Aquitalea magnusonii]|uniref:Uncharacterized protein n=1 Tax=Aquitalea magnusonii TaxID=332411 RepID=A0A318IY09_9NEIS|nr:hypothetical protein [Aquitalea magnusonii]PXX38857.1 hypothetical protein DFR38_1315 [Aquitalea magnusonii]
MTAVARFQWFIAAGFLLVVWLILVLTGYAPAGPLISTVQQGLVTVVAAHLIATPKGPTP